MESGACPPLIKPIKQDEDRDCELVAILSSKHFTFQSQLTSLHMIPTKYKFIIREYKNDYHTSIASKLITPYDWWLNNKVKIFSLQSTSSDHLHMIFEPKKMMQIFCHTKSKSPNT